MAFWGVEVKPGRPVTHSCEKASGRLRISQATLGIGEAKKTSLVQCNVGSKSPVLLCALLPDRVESCHLDLEFEEADDVIFSVIGPRSVYLSGYYVRQGHHFNPQSDTESYGVDIGNSDTEKSSRCSEDEEYEDSFIDDDELKVSPPSPIGNGEEVNETILKDEKPNDRKRKSKRLKKRNQVVESDDDDDAKSNENEDEGGYLLSVFNSKGDKKQIVSGDGDNTTKAMVSAEDDGIKRIGSQKSDGAKSHESEDEDGYLLSVFNKKGNKKKPVSQDVENTTKVRVAAKDKSKDGGTKRPESKKKADAVVLSEESERDKKVAHILLDLCDESGSKKDKNVGNEIGVLSERMETAENIVVSDEAQENNTKVDGISHNQPIDNGRDQIQSLSHVNLKKKHKRVSKMDDTAHEVENYSLTYVLKEDKAQGGPSKFDETHQNTVMNMETSGHNSMPSADLGSENGQRSKKRRKKLAFEDACADENDCQENELVLENDDKNLPDTNGEIVKSSVNDQAEEKHKRKKKKKKNMNEMLEVGKLVSRPLTTIEENKHVNDKVNSVSTEKKTLSNGLTIEELAKGEPDGKLAAIGKKVKVYYTGMLKETGQVFYSNVGKDPYKFRLGDEEIIDGWNVGIDGMRVGDKRRLIIPPSMGYGHHAMGENIPPNSWLVYDIELVNVRK